MAAGALRCEAGSSHADREALDAPLLGFWLLQPFCRLIGYG
jgi:hypothetical protein